MIPNNALEGTESIIARLVNLCWSLLGWGVLTLIVCAIMGGLFIYERVDEEIRRAIQQRLAAAMPDYDVSIQSARLVERKGFEAKGITIRHRGASSTELETVVIEEALFRCQPRLEDLASGHLKVTHATLRGMRLRVSRSVEGVWNVNSLLSCTDHQSCGVPLVDIENGTLEILDGQSMRPRLLAVRGINLRLLMAPPAENRSDPKRLGTRVVVEGDFGGDHLHHGTVKAVLAPQRQLWSAALELRGVQFGPELREALPMGFAEHLSTLGPLRARGDVTFRAARQLGQEATQFDLQGRITDGRWDDPRLPYPVTDLRATISGDRLGLVIRDITARYGTAALEMQIDRSGYTHASPTVVEGVVKSLTFTRQAVAVLPAHLQEVWRKFQPLGLADVEFRLSSQRGVWRPDLRFLCRDVSLRWEKFPYTIRQGTGEVRWADDKMHVVLDALAGDDQVHLRAEIEDPGPRWRGWSELKSAETVLIDERFIAAHTEQHQKILCKFAPTGRIRLRARGERLQAHLPVQKRIHLELADCSIRHEAFPYPIGHLTGRLSMVNGRWVFEDMVGRNGTGVLKGRGSWDPHKDDGRLELKIEGWDVPLEDDLRIALGPRFENAWRNIRPRGTIDQFHVQFEHLPERGTHHLDVVMEKRPPSSDVQGHAVSRAISILPAQFPYSIEQVTGKFRYQDGQVSFHDVAGRHGGVRIGARGSLHLAQDGAWRLRFDELTAERLRGDEDLMSALPPRLSRALSGFRHTGPVALAGAVEFSAGGSDRTATEARWDVSLDLEDTSYTSGVSLDHMSGQVRLRGGNAGGFHCRGDVNLDSMVFKETQITSVAGPLWIDKDRLLIGAWAEGAAPGQSPARMKAQAFGGSLEGDAQVVFDESQQFDLQVTVADANLARLVRETARQAPASKINGLTDAVVQLSGSFQGHHTWRGGGAIRVRDADIYELPFVVLLLKQLRTGEVGRTGFDSSEMDFRIHGDHAYFDRIELRGDALTLRGAGDVGLDHKLNLKLYTVMGRDKFYIPIVRPLLGEAARRLVMIRVTGDLENPQMVREVLPGLNESLQQFFPDVEATGERPAEPSPSRPHPVASQRPIRSPRLR